MPILRSGKVNLWAHMSPQVKGLIVVVLMFQMIARSRSRGSSWPISAEIASVLFPQLQGFSELLLQPQDMTKCISLVKLPCQLAWKACT